MRTVLFGRHEMPFKVIETAMSKRELIARELDHMPEQTRLDTLVG
jgi:hypothetical protein